MASGPIWGLGCDEAEAEKAGRKGRQNAHDDTTRIMYLAGHCNLGGSLQLESEYMRWNFLDWCFNGCL